MQALGERVERSEFLKGLACTPAGSTLGQIANRDVDNVKKELQKIIAKKVKRTSVNVAGEGDQGLGMGRPYSRPAIMVVSSLGSDNTEDSFASEEITE